MDLPAGTGFSYAKTELASHSTDLIQVRQADQFLRKVISWATHNFHYCYYGI